MTIETGDISAFPFPDNDAVVLWLHVIESLRRASPGMGDAALHALLGSADLIEVVLPCLVNELAEQADVVLVPIVLALFVGLLTGAYSSIFVATPMVAQRFVHRVA